MSKRLAQYDMSCTRLSYTLLYPEWEKNPENLAGFARIFFSTAVAGTILVDTINRSPAAGKTTLRDEAVLTKLEALLLDVKGDNLFQELQAARFDISGKYFFSILIVEGYSVCVILCLSL